MKRTLVTLLFTLLFASVLAASSPQEALDRMKERLPQIDAMKEKGEIGENAQGYLSARTALSPRKAAIVDAENDDRRILYLSVAANTGQSVEDVAANRAVRIAEIAREGVWIQLPNGEWLRKQ